MSSVKMSNSGLSAFWRGESALAAELKLLALPKYKRKRALAQMGREAKKQTRRNVKTQTNTRNGKFVARKRKRTLKGPMLSGLVKGRMLRQKLASMSINVGFRNSQVARVAAEHQYGTSRTFKAKPMTEKQKQDWRDEPASMAQARAIMRFGYRWKERGKDGKRKKISRQYIIDNLTKWQALGLLNELKHGKGGRTGGKKSWKVDLPSREFFANDAQWVKQMTHEVIIKELNRGQ